MAETIEVQVRQLLGTRNSRRLRNSGTVPAVLYGHGAPSVCLGVPVEQIDTAVRHGSRLINLTGAVNERAFIRELQWDTWGKEIVHVDLTRISEHELVEVRVAIVIHGEAPGVRAGGVIEHLIHEVPLRCEVTSIPEKLHVSINALKLDETITVAALELPANATVLLEPDDIIVQCVVPAVEVEEEGGEGASAEPEIIGRKKEDEEEDE